MRRLNIRTGHAREAALVLHRLAWQQLATEHDRAAAEQSLALTVDNNAQLPRAHFKLIDSARRATIGFAIQRTRTSLTQNEDVRPR